MNQQEPLQQLAEWHDPDLYRTTDCARDLVSDDYGLVCAVSVHVRVLMTAVCVL